MTVKKGGATRNRCVVSVPASSANLGSGFDVFAAALTPRMQLEVKRSESFAVKTDLAIARTRRNLCVRAFEKIMPADDFEFHIKSEIALSGGLGSSAAATVAGLLAAQAFSGNDVDLLALASEREGHPDNAAAALLGGVVVCADSDPVRIAVPAGLAAVVVVPNEVVRTRQARSILPRQVALGAASFNIGHASMLALGLERGDYDLVARGLEDRLHQKQRASLYPRSAELLSKVKELGALGATISGAGPTVLVWVIADKQKQVSKRLEPLIDGWAIIESAAFESRGAIVS